MTEATIGLNIGMLQKVLSDKDGNGPYWRLIESPIREIKINRNGKKIKTKDRFYTLDAKEIEENTKELEEANGYILTETPFLLTDELRIKANRWIEWANQNMDKAVSIISGQ